MLNIKANKRTNKTAAYWTTIYNYLFVWRNLGHWTKLLQCVAKHWQITWTKCAVLWQQKCWHHKRQFLPSRPRTTVSALEPKYCHVWKKHDKHPRSCGDGWPNLGNIFSTVSHYTIESQMYRIDSPKHEFQGPTMVFNCPIPLLHTPFSFFDSCRSSDRNSALNSSLTKSTSFRLSVHICPRDAPDDTGWHRATTATTATTQLLRLLKTGWGCCIAGAGNSQSWTELPILHISNSHPIRIIPLPISFPFPSHLELLNEHEIQVLQRIQHLQTLSNLSFPGEKQNRKTKPPWSKMNKTSPTKLLTVYLIVYARWRCWWLVYLWNWSWCWWVLPGQFACQQPAIRHGPKAHLPYPLIDVVLYHRSGSSPETADVLHPWPLVQIPCR